MIDAGPRKRLAKHEIGGEEIDIFALRRGEGEHAELELKDDEPLAGERNFGAGKLAAETFIVGRLHLRTPRREPLAPGFNRLGAYANVSPVEASRRKSNLWNDFRQTGVLPSVFGFINGAGADARSFIHHSGAAGQDGILEGE